MTAPRSRRTTGRHRQRGAALLTAMIIVTLVTTLAASMIWQQWRAVQVEAAERGRVQAAWILSGALDFASLILIEDARSKRPTALTEPWATPLAESRLSTFLAVDAANADEGPEAFLSGNIQDAQGKFNLSNLVNASEIDPVQVKALENLCETVGVESGIAARIASGLRDALSSGTSSGINAAAPLQPRTIAQLSWFGIDPAALKALEPYVSLLPAITKLNVNTASREVLAAVTGVDLATSESLLQVRQRTPFASVEAFSKLVPTLEAEALAKLDFRSDFFEVSGRLRLSDRVLVEHSLVQRFPQNRKVTVLHRERVSSLEQVGN